MDSYIYLILKAIAIGVLISAPMGPIGMLIIQRTLSKGRWPAFFTGIGAGLSDLVYCVITGFGLSFVTEFIHNNEFVIQLIGGIVLASFGMYLFSKNPTRALKPSKNTARNYWTDVVSGFFLTLSNPLIIFFIIGLFARFNFIVPDEGNLMEEYKTHHFLLAYAMIFAGALLWWYFITFIVNLFRKRFNVRSLWLINRIIGLLLIAIALYGIASAIFPNLKISIF